MLTLGSFIIIAFTLIAGVWWACKNDDFDSAQ